MMLKETLRSIVKTQNTEILKSDYGIEREKLKQIDLRASFALVMSGARRCGKSTLLRQLMKKIKKSYYFNFEDPRTVDFDVRDFQKLNEVFVEEFGKSNYYFFDEIQNVGKWELFVRAILDKKKICCHYWF
ncbi:MAG: AAA family ATPase [Candidatus Diapherotrites archaeon]